MSEQTKDKATTEKAAEAPKEISRTTKFQNELQKNLGEVLGQKLSRETAWKLFKECLDTTVVFVAKDEEKKLPLSGVGTFLIKMSPPRKPVVREGEEAKESKYAGIPELPRFRYKISERYKKYLLEEIVGYKEPEAPKQEAAPKKDEAPKKEEPPKQEAAPKAPGAPAGK